MIDRTFANRFAADWIAAWNSHDLDRVLAHYADDFEMNSPTIIRIAGEPSGRLKGKARVRAYWTQALRKFPDLRFEPVATLLGVNSVTLCYRGVNGVMSADAFVFGAGGKVVWSHAYYAA